MFLLLKCPVFRSQLIYLWLQKPKFLDQIFEILKRALNVADLYVDGVDDGTGRLTIALAKLHRVARHTHFCQ